MDESEVKRVADLHAQLDALARGKIRDRELVFVRDTLGHEHAFNAQRIRGWPASKKAMRRALEGTRYALVTWNGWDAVPHGTYDLVMSTDALIRNGMCMYQEQLTGPVEWCAPELAELPAGTLIRYGHHELRLLSPARVSRVSGRFGFVTPVEGRDVKVEFEGSVHESPQIGITEVARPLY